MASTPLKASASDFCRDETATFKGTAKRKQKHTDLGLPLAETVNPLKAGKNFASEPVWLLAITISASLGVDKDLILTIPRVVMKDLKASYVLNTPPELRPAAKNQVVGTINFQLDGKTIDQRPLVVLEEIPGRQFLRQNH